MLLSNKNIDGLSALIGVFLSAILIIIAIIKQLSIIYLLSFILVLLSCISWLLIREYVSLDFDLTNYILNNIKVIRSLSSWLFFVFLAFSFLSLHFRQYTYERPLSYFILISIMCGFLVFDILISKNNLSYVFFLKIMIVALSIVLSQLLLFPSVLGIDPWWHQMFTSKIIDAHLIPTDFQYSYLPIFHLYIGETSLATALDYKLSSILSVSLIQIICDILFIFLIANNLFNDKRIGFLASLFVITASHHISMSYAIIPTTLGTTLIPIICYLLLKLARSKPLESIFLSIILMVVLILTNTIAALFMSIILFLSWIGIKLYNELIKNGRGNDASFNAHFSLMIASLFLIMMFSWWTYATGNITTFGQLLKWGFSVDHFIFNPTDISEFYIKTSLFEQVFNGIGIFLFFSLSFIGIFFMISAKGNKLSFIIALIGLCPLFLSYLTILLNLYIIQHRWLYFSQLFLSIPLALTFLLIPSITSRRFNLNVILPPILIMIIIFLSIMTPTANVDNRTYSPNTMRSALTTSELQAIETISSVWDGSIKTDDYYSSADLTNHKILSFSEDIYRKNIYRMSDTLILVREEAIRNPILFLGSLRKINFDLGGMLTNSGFSSIYDSKSVVCYYKI